MMLNIDTIKNLLTKDVFDPYGLKIGKVITYLTDPLQNITSIGIEFNNGSFSYNTLSDINLEDNSIILNYPWQIESKHLNEEYSTILRKNSALLKLHNDGEISQEIFNELQTQYDLIIKNLTEKCNILTDNLQEKIRILNIQINDVKKSLINLKIEYLVQTIDEKFYNTSNLLLRNMLNHFSLEKKDIDSTLHNIPENSKFVQTIFQDLSPTTTVTNQSQPILIRIKESEP